MHIDANMPTQESSSASLPMQNQRDGSRKIPCGALQTACGGLLNCDHIVRVLKYCPPFLEYTPMAEQDLLYWGTSDNFRCHHKRVQYDVPRPIQPPAKLQENRIRNCAQEANVHMSVKPSKLTLGVRPARTTYRLPV
jgi:hypothetical protein